MSTANDATHILVFPYPAQGHMLPLLDLTNQLALRGLQITILVTPKNLPILSPILSAHPNSIQTLILPFPSHPKLPAGVEHIRDIGIHGIFPVAASLSRLAGPIADWFHSHPSPPQAILSDFFLGWTLRLAQDLRIPRIAFFSSGCFVSCVAGVLFSDIAGFKELDSVPFTDLPRSPVFEQGHLPSIFRFYDPSDPDSVVIKDGLLANLSSWGCVFNSFGAIEADYLEHFKKLQAVGGRAFGVGPLSLFKESEALNRVNTVNDKADNDVLRWLDRCQDESVLYISFGSQKWLTEAQLNALGKALETSRTPFVLVVQSSGPELGPRAETWLRGFEEQVRAGDRGYVVRGWAPQVKILEHRAVGGFLSHCGWNSTLESVVAGVMTLAWPMEADQYANARLLVEDLGVGFRACEGPDTVPDPDELGKVIGEAMGPGRGVEQKQRAKELKKKAVEAVKDGGSSAKDLNEFVNELVRIGIAN